MGVIKPRLKMGFDASGVERTHLMTKFDIFDIYTTHNLDTLHARSMLTYTV